MAELEFPTPVKSVKLRRDRQVVFAPVLTTNATHSIPCDLTMHSTCMHTTLNIRPFFPYRIVVVLENRISVFNFTRNPQELHQIDTAPNPRGTCTVYINFLMYM